jgi:hypothetical protein
MRHKVPCDTDTPDSTFYTKYLESVNSDRMRSLDILWRNVWTLLRVASLRARPRKTGDTECSGQREKALLMTENKPQEHNSEGRYSHTPTCEVYNLFGGVPCAEAGKVSVDGLVFCERHALEVKLEGQISCWDEMLFHIDLWSREAARRDREDIVGLLEVQRVEATSARHRAYTDLDLLRREAPWEHREEPPTRGSLLLLPPKADRPLSRVLRRR